MTLYQQNIHGFSPMRTGLALLPMVATMMIMSPISGTMINRLGPRRLISVGMTVTGIGIMFLLLAGVDATYYRVIPAFVLMGFGMSFIWAPMTTAVLNSVEPEKSGIASAINGAIREIGTAFGIALLGTIANRVYKDQFSSDAQVNAIRNDSALAPIHEVIDIIGEGAARAGVAVVSQLPVELKDGFGDAISTVQRASAEAFMSGMDRAVIVSGIGIIAAATLSWFLIDDSVVLSHQPDPASGDAAIDAAVKIAPAD
jgi:MFS family permease